MATRRPRTRESKGHFGSLGSYIYASKKNRETEACIMWVLRKIQRCLLLSLNLCGRYRSQAYLMYKILLIADDSSDHWKFKKMEWPKINGCFCGFFSPPKVVELFH